MLCNKFFAAIVFLLSKEANKDFLFCSKNSALLMNIIPLCYRWWERRVVEVEAAGEKGEEVARFVKIGTGGVRSGQR